ncbi:hypothetical protein LMG29542_08375 [Paraburkholderia humisilvae]|uniref:Uncharacterized protein n=1 Tax=Paraburkholderia humisilvae TaxID=627669 RepID=A0A6J5F9D5_9BURK|nr:hypothetical protein LMG29542_08375 [Paraburkholderia humisilvae]
MICLSPGSFLASTAYFDNFLWWHVIGCMLAIRIL